MTIREHPSAAKATPGPQIAGGGGGLRYRGGLTSSSTPTPPPSPEHPALAYQSALNGLQYEYGPEGSVSCRVRLGHAFASHAGHVHGGLVATLFDEVMGHAAYRTRCVPMVTTLLRVRFIEPVMPEVEHRLEVKVGTEVGGVLDVTAELFGEALVSAASAKFRPLKVRQSPE